MLGLHRSQDAARPALEEFSVPRLRRARAVRRAFLVLLAAFVSAGAANLLGGRGSTVWARGGGYELRVSFASLSRPGRDAGWSAEIRHEGGFAEPVRLATDSSYLQAFSQTNLRPEPSSSTTRGDRTVWEFDPPDGDTLHVTLEGQFGQGSTGVHPGSTAILGPGGDVLRVTYRSRVFP